MNFHEIIFTKRSPTRYYRHIIFWAVILFFLQGCNCVSILLSSYQQPSALFKQFLADGICDSIIDVTYSYIVVYRVVPMIERKKYGRFIASISGLTAAAYITRMLVSIWIFDLYSRPADMLWVQSWYLFMGFLNTGPLVKCGLFLAGKMLKNYYQKLEEKKSLASENAQAELQLLKAQIHPHFLFNTLNNIYSFSMNKPSVAGELVLKLSDTLRYMVSECEAPLVPVEKELKMLQDYIGLETVRYGKRLDLEVEVKGDYSEKLIAPLLLIPFVENCFKHGASQVLSKPWIRLRIDIADDMLLFTLMNSKPSQPVYANGKNGIGLRNVMKRLELLYPQQHRLRIESDGDMFFVNLQLQLQEAGAVRPMQENSEPVIQYQTSAYA